MPIVQTTSASVGAREANCGLQFGELTLGAGSEDGMETGELSGIKKKFILD